MAAIASGSLAQRADVGGGWQKLYGGRIFACRHCYDLAYPSQREAEFQRYQRRADKIRERLGWQVGFDSGWGPKPKGMHWRTFERLVAELEDFEHASDVSLCKDLGYRFRDLFQD